MQYLHMIVFCDINLNIFLIINQSLIKRIELSNSYFLYNEF